LRKIKIFLKKIKIKKKSQKLLIKLIIMKILKKKKLIPKISPNK
jgi:hypothetical protein